jgi:hypothetical protein
MRPIQKPLSAIAVTLLLCAPLPGDADTPEDAVAVLPAIAAAGSAEPHLATGADGTVVLSWIEPRGGAHALRFARLSGDAWGTPATVAEGDDWFVNWADFPSVVPIDGPLWAAHWLVKRPGGTYAYDVAVAISRDHGASWSAPLTPHSDGTATEHGFVSLFPAPGGVGALWLDGRDTAGHGGHGGDHGGATAGMTLRFATISADSRIAHERMVDDLVCDCCQTAVAIGPDGPVAVYRDRTSNEIRDIYVTRLIDGAWEPGRPVADEGWRIEGCPVNGPAIATRGARVGVAWFTAAGGHTAVRYAESGDGAGAFGAPVDVATDRPIGRVGLVLLEGGGALVSWIRHRQGVAGELVVRRIGADGRPAGERIIAELGSDRRSGVPQMVPHGDAVVLAWTDASGDRTHIRSARYEPAR